MTPARIDSVLDLPVDGTPVPLAAEMYARLGFQVVPVYGLNANGDGCACGSPDCQPRSWAKHPIGKRWQKAAVSDLDDVRDAFRGHRGNIGIMPGNDYITLDVDGDEGFRSIESLGELPLTLTSRSGSGLGEHRIFAYAKHQDPESITNRRVLPGLDVKTRTGQIVVAPSIHRSGERYRWIVPVAPAPLPDSLYDRIRKAPASVVSMPAPTRSASPDALEKRARAYIAKIPPAISGSGGHDQTFAAARAIAGFVDNGLSDSIAWELLVDYNATCQPPWSEKELVHKFKQAMGAKSKPKLPDRPAPGGAPDGIVVQIHGADTYQPYEGPRDPPPPSVTDWRARMVWVATAKGTRPAKHHENAVVVLRYHPQWAGKLRFNTFTQTTTVIDAPWHDSDNHAESKGEREWTGADSGRLSAWILRELSGLELSRSDCEQAVDIAAEAVRYHPVRDYFNSLTWDQTPRIATGAARYLGAEQTDYVAAVLRWWMIAAVARTYQPGVKADNVLILEGAQGLKKSSALRALAGPDWFSDTPLDLQSKDAYLALVGKLIVELAELDALRRADESRAKSFFTSPSDTYRRPYERRTVTVPRGCVFAGTVNHASYLKDSTGNRRYWPIACRRVDLDSLVADRDQLWAEAVAWFHLGAKWWPDTEEERAMCESEQEPRGEGDEWDTLIGKFLLTASDTSVGEVLAGPLGIEKGKWTRADQMRVAAVLQARGYAKYREASEPRGYRYRVRTGATS